MTDEAFEQASAAAEGGIANIKFGLNGDVGEYAGMTVNQVRQKAIKEFPHWEMAGDALAYKGKQQLKEEYVIQPDDQISFIKKMGEKGTL